MSDRTAPLKFAPPGLTVDGHEIDAGGLVVHAHGVPAPDRETPLWVLTRSIQPGRSWLGGPS